MARTELNPSPRLQLSGLINELRESTACSSTAAAYFLKSTFQAIKDFTGVGCVMPVSVCWVGHLESSEPKGDCAALLESLIVYFETRMSPFSTPENFICLTGGQESVPDHMIYFDRDQLAQLIRQSKAEVPRFLESKKNMAKGRSNSSVASMEVREWNTARQITRSLIKILVAASQRDGASIRQSAVKLGQKGQPHADARILREMAETLGLDFPKKTDTLVKFLESAEGEDG